MSGELSLGGVELGRILAGERHAPVVYFVRMGRYVKIGTTVNLKGRMRSFYLSLADVLVVVPGGPAEETAYHKRFAGSQHPGDQRRELFRVDGQLSRFLGAVRSAAFTADPGPETPETDMGELVSLRQACAEETLRFTGRDPLGAARKARQRGGFPAVAGWDGKTALYYRTELKEWQDGKVRVLR